MAVVAVVAVVAVMAVMAVIIAAASVLIVLVRVGMMVDRQRWISVCRIGLTTIHHHGHHHRHQTHCFFLIEYRNLCDQWRKLGRQ